MKTIEFTEEELQALIMLLDAGVKFMGIRAAATAAHLFNKLGADTREQVENLES